MNTTGKSKFPDGALTVRENQITIKELKIEFP
jgi:hypothetical protein